MGRNIEPRTARNYEVGHRWQGLGGRVDTSAAVYYVIQNNVDFRERGPLVIQAGEQRARGLDLDINADLGRRTHLILNYGYARPRFEEADDLELTGIVPRYVPRHTANAWLRKDWVSRLNASVGIRHVGSQFADNENAISIGGFTVFSGAVGYRTENWEWSMNAENLFNRERYFLPGHFSGQVFPGQPINVSTTIRYVFR